MSTRRFGTLMTAIVLAAASPFLAAAQQTPVRDAPATAPPQARRGTGAIAGRVVTFGSPSTPVRRATVTVTTQTGTSYDARRVVTNDDGSFEIGGLAAGRYFVQASKPAYLSTALGFNRPPRMGSGVTGTALPLADGERVTDVVLTMTRGGVITGTIRDTDGRPARGASVALAYLRRSAPSGERVLAGAPSGQAVTDSRGVYRIFGIAPGEYVLMAGFTGRDEARDLEITTEADIRRLNEMSKPGYTPTGSAAPASEPRRATFGYAPVYYPGTIVAGEAQRITLGPGEERGGIDLQVQLVANSRVDGIVIGLDNRPAAGARVWLESRVHGGGPPVMMRSATTDAQGAFRLTGIAPGQYSAEVRPEPGRAGGPGPAGWGRTEFSLAAGSDASIQVALRPGLTVSGRLAFEPGSAPPPDDLSSARVLLMSETGAANNVAIVSPDGRFVATGVVPERYRISATVPRAPGAAATAAWYLKSATLAGQDAVDAPVDLRTAADPTSFVVTMTDRATEIAGVIQDGKGQPAPEYSIVAFPVDRAFWTWNSRRIQQARPGRDGRFSFRNLPAGDYLIGAVTDVEQNEWFEPAFLEMLFNVSAKVTLPAGGRVVQDLRIR